MILAHARPVRLMLEGLGRLTNMVQSREFRILMAAKPQPQPTAGPKRSIVQPKPVWVKALFRELPMIQPAAAKDAGRCACRRAKVMGRAPANPAAAPRMPQRAPG